MRFLLLGCWGLLLAAVGCGQSEAPLAPVSGQVFYQGKPLAGGTIVFAPDQERGASGALARGEIGPDGHYVLTTDKRPGAVLGWHRITIAASAPPLTLTPGGATPGLPSSRLALPIRYRDPEQSGLRFEVKPDQVNQHDLHLE
jgi:hypothetical protein